MPIHDLSSVLLYNDLNGVAHSLLQESMNSVRSEKSLTIVTQQAGCDKKHVFDLVVVVPDEGGMNDCEIFG